MIERDGWYLVTTRGSHRQFKHQTKLGRVTVAGGVRFEEDSSMTTRSRPALRYAVVIEKANRNYSAYVPDLPGCVATGPTASVVRKRIAKAIQMHLRGMKEDGAPIPRPRAVADYVVAAA